MSTRARATYNCEVALASALVNYQFALYEVCSRMFQANRRGRR